MRSSLIRAARFLSAGEIVGKRAKEASRREAKGKSKSKA
jgi:hypothetical protein